MRMSDMMTWKKTEMNMKVSPATIGMATILGRLIASPSQKPM